MKLNKRFEKSNKYEKFLSNGLSKDSVGLNHYNSFNLYLNLYKEYFKLWSVNFSKIKNYMEYR